MAKKNNHNNLCFICKKEIQGAENSGGSSHWDMINNLIKKEYPNWNEQQLCYKCLNHYRGEYVKQTIEKEKGELSDLDMQVVKSLKEQEILTKNLNLQFRKQLTFGQKVADIIAKFGGSWRFILSFLFLLSAWIGYNVFTSVEKTFDPYPFILLNLILSCIAALQAPVIMMSQNRQETKDRMRAEHDFKINLKAELEIRHLNLKLDQLMTHQWQRLLEIQEIQTQLMEELANKKF